MVMVALHVCPGRIPDPLQFRDSPLQVGIVEVGQAVLDGPIKPAQFFLGVGGLMLQGGDPFVFLLGVIRPALHQ